MELFKVKRLKLSGIASAIPLNFLTFSETDREFFINLKSFIGLNYYVKKGNQ